MTVFCSGTACGATPGGVAGAWWSPMSWVAPAMFGVAVFQGVRDANSWCVLDSVEQRIRFDASCPGRHQELPERDLANEVVPATTIQAVSGSCMSGLVSGVAPVIVPASGVFLNG